MKFKLLIGCVSVCLLGAVNLGSYAAEQKVLELEKKNHHHHKKKLIPGVVPKLIPGVVPNRHHHHHNHPHVRPPHPHPHNHPNWKRHHRHDHWRRHYRPPAYIYFNNSSCFTDNNFCAVNCQTRGFSGGYVHYRRWGWGCRCRCYYDNYYYQNTPSVGFSFGF